MSVTKEPLEEPLDIMVHSNQYRNGAAMSLSSEQDADWMKPGRLKSSEIRALHAPQSWSIFEGPAKQLP